MASLALFAALFAQVGGASAPPGRPDRASVQIRARVSDDLGWVEVETETRWIPRTDRPHVPVVLLAERFRPPAPLPAAMEPLVFPRGFDPGGFEALEVRVEGAPCAAELRSLPGGARWMACGEARAAGVPARVTTKARLRVPERYGPFGRIGRQLTLGGGWYPAVATPGRPPPEGRIELEVSLPAGVAAVVGGRFFPWVPGAGRRTVKARLARAGGAPLLVLPPETRARSVCGGRGVLVDPRGPTASPEDGRRQDAFASALCSGLRFAPRSRAPILLVEAPLRRELARGLEGGVVLASDRAYRFPALERLDAFHDRPILRAVFFALALVGAPARPPEHPVITADAVAAASVDAWTRAQGEKSEDAFDVLGLFSFVPAVDTLLYAPQIPFVKAYFRVVREDDPLRADLVGSPAGRPRGKIVYEKLADRSSFAAAQAVLRGGFSARPLSDMVEVLLEESPGPDAQAFLETWLGPHPEVAYRLGRWSSSPVGAAHVARVEIERLGAEVAEPVTVRLEDAEGRAVERTLPADPAPLRVLGATLTAPLASVTVDPEGRLAQTAALGTPNPRLDDRSHPGWRVLLNSFNLLIGATASALDARLAFTLARRWDPTWRFGISAIYAPEALSGTLSATRGLGPPVTPNQRVGWIGASATVDRLQAGFVEGAGAAWALRASVYAGWDDRTTLWAPEAGLGLRARLGYARVLGREGAAPPGETTDALSLSLAGVRSVRVGARHTLSVRARVDAWWLGQPRPQLLFDLGGRRALRGYGIGVEQGSLRGLVSAEWVHDLLRELEVDTFGLMWIDRVDGALFADAALIGDDLGRLRPRADLGYGFRVYLDYLGVRPGVLAVDVAVPLLDSRGRPGVSGAEVYVAFAQSFLSP